MHVYFSHSYRDVAINSYFMGHLGIAVGEQAAAAILALRAD